MNDPMNLVHLPVAFLVLDERLKPLFGSRKGFSVFGVRLRREGITSRILESLRDAILVSGFSKDFTVAITEISRPGGESTFRWERGDRIFEVGISQLDHADVYGVVFKDVTRQVQFEETREMARRYLEDILNNVDLGVVVLSDEMRVTNVNRAQELFWGRLGVNLNWVEAIGKPISELVSKDSEEPWDQITETVLKEGKTFEGLGRRYATTEGDLILSVAITPLIDQAGSLVGAIQVSEDVTERVRLEEELHEAEVVAGRLEAVKETAITVKHEINNPLTTILAIAQVLLMSDENLEEKTRTRLEVIEREVKRIAKVTQRLQKIDELKHDDYITDGPKMIDLGLGGAT
ncbi:MAG: PAS domain S-box protein [Candidatus Latescibacterota bacterium]|nr:PAS domain S-box protein [Candidatus Latescibacterota bacterium]